ncbi:Carbonic anhydrase 4 [Bagarius yarrelli]|uniref:Carbonic anhydrase 4 n=1 Tax=Bagarius yarrelli TaxID=175774 RepID=A0A556TX29_BAGYA|nr:Carbonic anhydrase 4 [Bagarius yarrelli]
MWFALLVSCCLLAPCVHSEPSEWAKDFPACGGQKQSPINIVTHKTRLEPCLTPIVFEGYTQTLNVTVQNTGNTAVFELPPSLRIRGGDLPDTYNAVQLHLHWGMDDEPGSEHTLDGEQYAMELSTEENQKFNQVIQALGRIPYNGNTSIVPEFRLTDILPSLEKLSSYYRYSGSLTTPGCNEGIIWTVFKKSSFISQQQLMNVTKQMRFETGKPMIKNFRPVQKLNERTVYKSTAVFLMSSGPVFLCLCLFCMFVLTENIF